MTADRKTLGGWQDTYLKAVIEYQRDKSRSSINAGILLRRQLIPFFVI